MKYGFVMPFGDARDAADLAAEAEEAGWDGFFVWEPVWGVDAWVSLTAAAMVTRRIRLGTMLTPPSRIRPWKLASETATLDNLSGGRVILSVGLGAVDTGFAEFGEVTDRKTRAELMDEALDIVTGLWRGQPFKHDGKHYHVKPTTFYPPTPPVQRPRIPIWVVGLWPNLRSMRRVLKYDGILPATKNAEGQFAEPTPGSIRAIKDFVERERAARTPFDIVVEGRTPGDDPDKSAAQVRAWQESGATWWIEALWGDPGEARDLAPVAARIRQGPPRST